MRGAQHAAPLQVEWAACENERVNPTALAGG